MKYVKEAIMSDEIGGCCLENKNCSKLNKQGVCVCVCVCVWGGGEDS